jgi:hypothetical protein
MANRLYEILKDDWGWAYRGPHELSRTFATREAAMLAAIGEIRKDASDGHEVELIVEGRKFSLQL